MLISYTLNHLQGTKKSYFLSRISKKDYSLCPICYAGPTFDNPVAFHPETGFFSCKECHNIIINFIPSQEYLIGQCLLSNFNVSGPFSLLCRKPYYGVNNRPSSLNVDALSQKDKWDSIPERESTLPNLFYVDPLIGDWIESSCLTEYEYQKQMISSTDAGSLDKIQIMYTPTIFLEKIWTYNLPVYFVSDTENGVISPLMADPAEHYSYKDPISQESTSYFDLHTHLSFDPENHCFTLSIKNVVCTLCGSSKMKDPDLHFSFENMICPMDFANSHALSKSTEINVFRKYLMKENTIANLLYHGLGLINSQNFQYQNKKYYRKAAEDPEDTSYLFRYTHQERTQIICNNPIFNMCFTTRGSSMGDVITLVDMIELMKRNLCLSCRKSRLSTKRKNKIPCKICGDSFWQDGLDITACKPCQANVQKHDFNVMTVLKSKRIGSKKRIFRIPMGVELEICSKKEDLDRIKDNITEKDGHFLFKWDGSINMSAGFEIVSSPLRYKEHLLSEGWKSIFSEDTTLVEDIRCGMHIHVPRTAFPKIFLESERKFSYPASGDFYDKSRLSYLHRCVYSSKNRNFISNIAARGSSNNYAPFDGRHYRDGVKYTGLNTYTKSAKTVEFRIFQSPTSFNKFLANLQFVDAFTSFFRQIEDKSILSDSKALSESFLENGFYDFIHKNNKHYDLLEPFLSNKEGEIDETPKPSRMPEYDQFLAQMTGGTYITPVRMPSEYYDTSTPAEYLTYEEGPNR